MKRNNIQIIGLHSHSGSGILTPALWQKTAFMLTALIGKFPEIRLINLCGSIGVVEKPGQKPLDLAKLDAQLSAIKSHYPHLKFWMEPGRFYAKKTVVSNIVGPICETGDTMGYNRLMPITRKGDVILIANAGAYGHCMSSYYNLRPPTQELSLES